MNKYDIGMFIGFVLFLAFPIGYSMALADMSTPWFTPLLPVVGVSLFMLSWWCKGFGGGG